MVIQVQEQLIAMTFDLFDSIAGALASSGRAVLASGCSAVQISEAATELRPLHSERQQIGSWFVSHSRWTRR